MTELDTPPQPRTIVTIDTEIVQCAARIAALEAEIVQGNARIAEHKEQLKALRKERKNLESGLGRLPGVNEESRLGDSLGSGSSL